MSSTSSGWAGEANVLLSVDRTKMDTESHAYYISITESCIVEGRVGQISDSVDYCMFKYRWGMFMYPQTHPVTGNTYLVINYYVQDAIPYYPENNPTTTVSTAGPSSFAPTYLIVATIIVMAAFKHRKRSKE